MIDKIKEVLGGAAGLVMVVGFGFGYAFSWLLGIFTAVMSDQAPGWMLFDIIVSLVVPFYGTITWLFYIFG